MKFWDRILQTEHGMRKRVENAFGKESTPTPLEIRREVLEQVEARIAIDKGKKLFLYEKIEIHIHPETEALRDVFETAFLRDKSLEMEIHRRLREEEIQQAGNLEITVQVHEPVDSSQAGRPSQDLLQLNFIKMAGPRERELPELTLQIIKGSVEQAIYRMKQERVLIGRLSEVTDQEGRMVRKNDVVFLDNGDDINSTVGRIHARIWFDSEKQEFRIMDESSRYGTRVVREGRSIEVPGGNSRGIRLKSGDQIYFGQACVRFELPHPQ
jgi:hypothetical protein